MGIHGRAPRGSLVAESVLVWGKLLESEKRMEIMSEAYFSVGLLTHDGKAFQRRETATFWAHRRLR